MDYWLIFFQREHPEITIINKLGSGRYGNAYEIPNNKVLKLTCHDREYDTAKKICKKHFRHVVDVYECGDFVVFDSDGFEDKIHFVIEEKLDTGRTDFLENFLQIFRHTWFGEYFPTRKKNATYNDIEKILQVPNHPAIDKVKTLLLKDISAANRPITLRLYKEICEAYYEILQSVPDAHIDLHSQNMGFDSRGNLKLFDFI